MSFGPLVSTQWLADHLGKDDLVVLDASWHMPAAQRDARRDYDTAHIPGALFYDLDALSDRQASLPHMLAAPETFAAAISALGVGSDDRIVVYDTSGLFSAPRAWWTFRAMGHDKVAVLDGGLPKWRREGRPVEGSPVHRAPKTFIARLHPELIADADRVSANLSTKDASVLDARSSARFEGREAEPRAGLRGGHIPGSRNIPYASVLTPEGCLRGLDELRQIFARAGADLTGPVITSCGSGVTASILALALFTLGKPDTRVYDGSWSEWGVLQALPVATGPAD